MRACVRACVLCVCVCVCVCVRASVVGGGRGGWEVSEREICAVREGVSKLAIVH